MPARASFPPLNTAEKRAAAKASRQRNDGRPMLSVEDAAAYLAVSRWTVYRIIKAGHLRAFQVEGVTRIRPSDLDDYLDSCIAS